MDREHELVCYIEPNVPDVGGSQIRGVLCGAMVGAAVWAVLIWLVLY
jgi:hypothetical protein